jgi:hypothetical protein
LKLAPAAFPPGEPTIRRVTNATLRPASSRVVARGCAGGERLLSGWNAVGFYMRSAPSTALLASVSVSQSFSGARVVARARADDAIGGVRTVLQVGAVCGGGS